MKIISRKLKINPKRWRYSSKRDKYHQSGDYTVNIFWTEISGVGLSIRFGRNSSILVGQSRTPSKSVEFTLKLFLRRISTENSLGLQSKQLYFFQFLISSIIQPFWVRPNIYGLRIHPLTDPPYRTHEILFSNFLSKHKVFTRFVTVNKHIREQTVKPDKIVLQNTLKR
jgi:hypothetical protein